MLLGSVTRRTFSCPKPKAADCKALSNMNVYIQNLLSDVRQEEFNVVGVSPLDQTEVDSVRSKRPLQDSLKQTVGSNFHDNSILWNVLDGLVEEHRGQQVVDVVCRRAELSQRGAPS